MSSHLFALSVPSDRTYRGLAAEVAQRFVETLGLPASECETLHLSLEKAVDSVAKAGDDVHLSFESGPAGLDVSVRCGAEATSVHCVLPARKA